LRISCRESLADVHSPLAPEDGELVGKGDVDESVGGFRELREFRGLGIGHGGHLRIEHGGIETRMLSSCFPRRRRPRF